MLELTNYNLWWKLFRDTTLNKQTRSLIIISKTGGPHKVKMSCGEFLSQEALLFTVFLKCTELI